MNTLFREAIRDDLEAQFELPYLPPPLTKNRAKDFTCFPGPGACDECPRRPRIICKADRKERDLI
nr:hypothetical protein RP007_01020 [Rhizobium sp. P007]